MLTIIFYLFFLLSFQLLLLLLSFFFHELFEALNYFLHPDPFVGKAGPNSFTSEAKFCAWKRGLTFIATSPARAALIEGTAARKRSKLLPRRT